MDIINKINVNGTTYQIGTTVVTLPTVPNTNTLNYNGTDFAPGDVVRVADASSDTGYAFYRLHTIDNNRAVWAKLETGDVTIPEIITISFATNQASTTDLQNVATATIAYDSTTETKTYTGSDITFEIPEDTAYTITFGSVSGYATPSMYSRTSIFAGRPATTATYNTEVVTVTVDTSNSSTVVGQVITINGNTYTLTSSNNPLEVKVPWVAYTISADDKSGFTTPDTVSIAANELQTTRSVTLTYTEILNGVFIYTNTGSLVSTSSWNTANNGNAVGVAVITDNSSFVIAKGDSNGSKAYYSDYTTHPNMTSYSSWSAACNASETGDSNTDNIIAKFGSSTTYAAGWCRAYSPGYRNGEWHIGTAREWQDAYNNKTAIDDAMSLIGGTAMNTSSYHWSSNYYSHAYNSEQRCYFWILYWLNGSTGTYNAADTYYVRPFLAF